MKIVDNTLLQQVLAVAKEAGKKILTVYDKHDHLNISTKKDDSPLTEADIIAHHYINEALSELTPQYPVLSEEGTHIPYDARQQWTDYWLVDPLDGTREFIQRTGEFTVNIALISHHRPILGVIYAPAFDVSYFSAIQIGVFKQENTRPALPIKTREKPTEEIIIALSRRSMSRKLDEFYALVGKHHFFHQGSSLKFGLVAEGKVDIYPRFGDTSEWDTAAGQCIVEQAGGVVMDITGNPLRYNTKSSLINPPFFVFGDPSFAQKLLPSITD